MSLTVLTQAELSERVGGDDALALLASPSATLDTDAENAISRAITDVSSEIESALQGLGLDYSVTVPEALQDIGAVLVKARLYELLWSRVPADIKEAAKTARERLKAFAAGQGSPSGSSTAQQNAARFSWSNPGDNPDTSNPRVTVRARMRRLP